MDFVGRGWAFPLDADAAGRVLLVDGDRKIEQSMRLILGTAFGERPMRPEFGCGIHDLLFSAVDATTRGSMAAEVRASLARWEPRIEVTDVAVDLDPGHPGAVLVGITYTRIGHNDPRNLVFPFYSIPGEGS